MTAMAERDLKPGSPTGPAWSRAARFARAAGCAAAPNPFERFDDLVLLAVSQLEPRWEADLAVSSSAWRRSRRSYRTETIRSRLARLEPAVMTPTTATAATVVLYRRPVIARADSDEELAELVLDVIVEEFAHLLGVDPQTVDAELSGRQPEPRPPGASYAERDPNRRAAEPRSASSAPASPAGASRPR